MTKLKRTTGKPPGKHKSVGRAIVYSHLEAIRTALVAYDLDWWMDGFAGHWQEQLDRIAARQRTDAMAIARGRRG